MPTGIYKRTELHGKRISQALKGIPSKRKGKKLSQETRDKIRATSLGRKHTEATKQKMRKIALVGGYKPPVKKGSESPFWKGDKVKYTALHQWVYKQLGQPSFCVHCGTKGAKKFEWANVSRKYKRIIDDWIRLCVSCHRKFDNGNKCRSKRHELIGENVYLTPDGFRNCRKCKSERRIAYYNKYHS